MTPGGTSDPERSVVELAGRVEELASRVSRLEERLRTETVGTGPSRPGDEDVDGPPVPDGFYQAFEGRMRGTPESIVERLRVYEPLAREHLASIAGSEERRWLDLGCGSGEFCGLLREWGWRVSGVDRSPAAVERCRMNDVDAVQQDVVRYLGARPDGGYGAVSAIQLIEHLPKDRWLPLFDEMLRVLVPGGLMLLETVNARNPRAIADHFYADVSHTWPGHPETLRLMCEYVGSTDVEVRFEHPDAFGSSQDVAVVARKPNP
jgi:SAM-dependent methyltransferase